jgi:16S rRNA C967 or C1407 C5-methylase (RsmB/RsmF family)
MKNEGRIVAEDVDPKRLKLVVAQLRAAWCNVCDYRPGSD